MRATSFGELNSERDRYREALERIAGWGPGARAAYYDRLKGIPVTFDAVQAIANEALKPIVGGEQ